MVALLLSPSASPAELVGATSVSTLSAQEQSLLAAINAARAANGAPPLRIGARLQRAADAHSAAMARSGSFTHGNWYRRLRAHGVRGRTLGETIAWGVGSAGTAQAIVAMWMASPPHRATMLRPGFRRVGVGIAIGHMSGYSGARVATADFSGS
ncbi:MAG TPA: CAP domain-containing protein [Gaiellaceae bacterium]|nr:CAP domain-containing protein [Gaiellaceae bacterium]